MDSDDDQCDLETLEALLEEEESDDGGVTDNHSQHTDQKAMSADKSVEDFLNADSEDDCDDNNGEDKSADCAQLDPSDLDALASLVDCDSDFEEFSVAPEVKSDISHSKGKSQRHAKSMDNESIMTPSLGKQSPSHMDDKSSKYSPRQLSQTNTQTENFKKKKCESLRVQEKTCASSRHSSSLHRTENDHQKRHEKFRGRNTREHVGDRVEAKHDRQDVSEKSVEQAGLTATEILQERMAQMQKELLTMQKLLEQQQQIQLQQSQVAGKPLESQKSETAERLQKPNDPQKISVKKTNISKSSCENSSQSLEAVKAKSQTSTEVKHGRNSKGTLTLLPDDHGGNLFLGQSKNSPSAPTTTQQTRKRDSSSSGSITNKRDEMKRDLFGDSDSDWEDMDGGEKKTLSEAGRDIQRLLHSNERKREAHQPKYSVHDNSGGKTHSWARCASEVDVSMGWKNDTNRRKELEKASKDTLQCKSSSSDQAKPASTAVEDEKFVTEDFSKIRIINPLVSSSLMKLRMEGRKMISVSRIHTKLKTTDLQGDWVTIAVLVGKTDARSSSTGKPYSIWKLNDLEDLDNSVSFFLFGEVHKHLWKTDVGTVIGVLNPSIMESMEKNNSEPAFTIKNPSQLMIMGRSKDLGWCAGKTKKGNKCSKFINKRQGEFCAYHVQAAYRKISSTRLEFHGSVTGIKPKSFEKKIFSKNCAYMYGGCTYVQNSSGDKAKKSITLSKLKEAASSGRQGKVNTLSIHNVKPELGNTPKAGRVGEDPNDTFVDLITVPSPGSMNLVAFLKSKEETGSISNSLTSTKRRGPIQSITAKELIKQHAQLMQQKRASKRKASDGLHEYEYGKSAQNTGAAVKVQSDPLKQVPKLGKGFYSGQDVCLDVSSRSMNLADRAKLKAIAAVKGKGGIKEEDPNAVKKIDKDITKITKRVKDDCDKSSSEEQTSSPGPSVSSKEPVKKKSRLLGNVDLNSDEVKSILKARSKHKGALAEAEAEREEVYFNELEKKEMLEEKLKSVTSIEISVITCKQCQYTAQSAKESCKQEGHVLTRSKTKKRFFMCKKCKHRTFIIGGKFPTEACRNCGAQSYEKTSMYKERAGPKLDSEVLNIRGDEIKYLNSMDQKVFLNTVIDD